MSRMLTILIVDDSRDEREAWGRYVAALKHVPRLASSMEEALSILDKLSVDVLLTDIHLTNEIPGESPAGIQLLAAVTASQPGVACIAMTSDPSTVMFEAATSAGALQFLRKPIIDKADLGIAIQIACERHRANTTHQLLAQGAPVPADLKALCPEGVLVSDENMQIIRGMAAEPTVPLVIMGETGTGKEEIAKMLWRERCRRERQVPFVPVNCSHLEGDISLSMLFGHKKGAFSGATETTNGFIGDADGGLLFLDEVQTLSRPAQLRLLRVLNDGKYHRLGESGREMTSKFQLIVASTKNLDEEVANGNLLLDLRTRISGLEIHLPPLRERKEDLPVLLRLAFAKQGVTLAPNALQAFIDEAAKYYWQGNIRQLFREIETAVLRAKILRLPLSIDVMPSSDLMRAPASKAQNDFPTIHCYEAMEVLKQSFTKDMKLESVMDTVEKSVIDATCARHRTLTAAHDALGIAKTTMDQKRRKHGLKERQID